MKKRALMALPKLTATDEMKQIAASDLPRKEKTTYGYEYHAEKLRKIADKLQAGIGYDYDKAVERCKKKRAKKSHSSDVGEDALLLTVRAANKSADNKKEAEPYEEDTPWEPELE